MEDENKIPSQPTATQPITSEALVGSRRPRLKWILVATIFVIILIIILTVAYFIKHKAEEQKNATLQNINIAYLSGNLKKAEEGLVKVNAKNPSDIGVLVSLIKVIANQGSQTGTEDKAFQEGKPYVDMALKLGPNNVDVLNSVGYLYEIDGKYQDALNYYKKAQSIDPKSAEAVFHEGHTLEFLGRQTEAYQDYEKAYQLDSKNPNIVMVYAKVLLSKGNIEGAFNMYQVVVDNKSSSTTQQAEALTNQSIIKRGQILYMQDAIDLSKRAVDTDSNYAPALAAYGFNLGINGKFGEGVNFLKKSLEVNPRISQNYYYLGVLYRSVGDLNSAVDYQEKGYDSIDKDNTILDPTTKNKLKGNMAYDLAKTYDTLGKENQVLSLLQEAVRLNPKLVQTLKNDYKNKKQFQSLATNANFRLLVQ